MYDETIKKIKEEFELIHLKRKTGKDLDSDIKGLISDVAEWLNHTDYDHDILIDFMIKELFLFYLFDVRKYDEYTDYLSGVAIPTILEGYTLNQIDECIIHLEKGMPMSEDKALFKLFQTLRHIRNRRAYDELTEVLPTPQSDRKPNKIKL